MRPLNRLAKATAVPMQTFTVQPGRDTVVRSAAGTLVRITAGTFALATDTATALTAPVTLRVRELATMPDIILANFTTRATDGKLLETGGALWLEAATADGQTCVLRAGRDLHLAMPVRGARRPAMRAFTADSAGPSADGLRWRPTTGIDPAEVVRAHPPAYGPGLAQLENALRARLRFTPTSAQEMAADMPAADRRRLRKEWSESGRVLRYTKTLKQGLDVLSMSFDVAENGSASNWGPATGYHADLREALQQAVPALPGVWQAGSCAGRAAAMRARLMLICFDDGLMDIEIRCEPDDWSPCETPARAQFLAEFERRPVDPVDAEAAAATARDRPTDPAELVGSRYLLDAPRLGWVTCHRIADSPSLPITYAVPTGANTDVRLVFRHARVVLAGTRRGAETHFTDVPTHEPVTVVAVRTDAQGQAWLALQQAVIGEPLISTLTYRRVSPAQLRTALAALEPVEQ